MGYAVCQSNVYSSKESFLPISYTFSGGNIYGLISDFGRGSWALATCLGGKGEWIEGDVLLNNTKIIGQELLQLSCFVGEKILCDTRSDNSCLSAKMCIDRALKISGLNYTTLEIKNLFSLSDERFERDMNCVGKEIWRISTAIGFALNKEIFCYPWLNTHDVVECIDESMICILKRFHKIVIIPLCRAALNTSIKKSFDNIINFHDYQQSCFQIHPEERKRLSKIKGW